MVGLFVSLMAPLGSQNSILRRRLEPNPLLKQGHFLLHRGIPHRRSQGS